MKEPKDYVIRLIRRIILILSRIAGLISDKRYTEARRLINLELEELTGLPVELLDRADGPFLSHMLSLNEHPERILAVASLYFWKGRLADELGDPIEGRRIYFIAQECLMLIQQPLADRDLQARFEQLSRDIAFQLSQ